MHPIYKIFKKEEVLKCKNLFERNIQCLDCGKDHKVRIKELIHFYSCGNSNIIIGIDSYDIRCLAPFPEYILNGPLSNLNLSSRLWKALCYYESEIQAWVPEFETVEDLLRVKEEDLINRKVLGRLYLRELRLKLARLGFEMGQYSWGLPNSSNTL
jgi:hypothetical protein